MERKTRLIFVLTLMFSSVAVALLITSLATEYWIESFPIRLVDNQTLDGAVNVTEGDPGTKFKGHIHYGLFFGEKRLDSGLGVRVERILVSEQVVEKHMYSIGLWLSTIVVVCVAITFGVTVMVISAINTWTRPIQTILGPVGVYVCSSCAIAVTLTAAILYLVLFYADMKTNVLSEEELLQRWTSTDRTHFHYSFYILFICLALFSANIITVALSSINFKPIRYATDMNGKSVDGLMMY